VWTRVRWAGLGAHQGIRGGSQTGAICVQRRVLVEWKRDIVVEIRLEV
jgi:hypothetical protein